MKLKIYKGYYSKSKRKEIESDYKSLYLFGDNLEDRNTNYVPYKTQAVIRGLKNSFGIPTKFNRYTRYDSYMSLNELNNTLNKIIPELKKVLLDNNYEYIVYPSFGIGTGKAIDGNPKLTNDDILAFECLTYVRIKILLLELN